MTDVQRHVHYTKVPFASKLFYIGVGAALYYFAFAGGCQKARAMQDQASIPNSPANGVYQEQTTKEKIDQGIKDVDNSLSTQICYYAPFMKDVGNFVRDTTLLAKKKIEDMVK